MLTHSPTSPHSRQHCGCTARFPTNRSKVPNHDDLHKIRDDELRLLAQYMPVGATILELGAGTGYQARELAKRGFVVKAIDVQESNYRSARVYPVVDYDGTTLPFPDASFDIVFSSNVLEHVVDLPAMLAEIRRVLKPGGRGVHAMPTTTWRWWTTVAGPIDCLPFVLASLTGRAPRGPKRRNPIVAFARGIAARWIPLPHGERGNALTELVTFGKRHWVNQFEQNGFEVIRSEPMHLFYTGWNLFGHRLPIDVRRTLARTLGSACQVYEVRPR